MGATVIQHRHRRRKRRRSAWAWAARRLGVLAMTILGLAAATWVAPFLDHRAPAPIPPLPAQAAIPAPPPAYPELVEVNVAIDLAAPPAARSRAPTPLRGIPLNASIERRGDDYEILTAAELAAISQARD